MSNLRVQNKSGSTYNFFVDNYSMRVEAKATNGKVFLFAIPLKETVVGGKLKTACGKELPITEKEEEIVAFLKNAKTKRLYSFDSKKEAEAFRQKNNSGAVFLSYDKYCTYVYNNGDNK